MFQILGAMLWGLAEWKVHDLLARLLWHGTGAMSGTGAVAKSGFDDPVYKKNVQRLIEQNRRFEEESKNR
jgi:hypothetical protein